MNIKHKNLDLAEKEISDNDLTITHYISTSTPDRYGEIMNPSGCNYKEFRKNPVVFFGHRSGDLPVAKNEKLVIDDFGVLAVTKFDTSDFAKEVFRLNKEGFLNSWSIGYIPKKINNRKMKTENAEQEFSYIDEWELMEYSSVPIPANPDAVNLILKEVKNERVRRILEEQKNFSTHSPVPGRDEQIIMDKLTESKKETGELIKMEFKIFEDRLVRKLNNIINVLSGVS